MDQEQARTHEDRVIMLTRETQHQLTELTRSVALYQPNMRAAATISSKVLVMIVAPAASGKTYLMNHVVQLDPEFCRASTLTTREPRADDGNLIRTLSHNEANIHSLIEKIHRGDLISYAIHPTSGRLYITESEDYPGHYIMLATLSGVVTTFKRLPFAHTCMLGLVSTPDDWRTWFEIRYPTKSAEKQRRLEEAVMSLEWLLTQPDKAITWVINTPHAPNIAARAIIDAARYNKKIESKEAREYAQCILVYAKEML